MILDMKFIRQHRQLEKWIIRHTSYNKQSNADPWQDLISLVLADAIIAKNESVISYTWAQIDEH